MSPPPMSSFFTCYTPTLTCVEVQTHVLEVCVTIRITFSLSHSPPQSRPCSRWCAPTTLSSISSFSTRSLSLGSCSLPCSWCATKAATTARTRRARMAPPCYGSRNRTSAIPQPVWTHLLSACTLALWNKTNATTNVHTYCGPDQFQTMKGLLALLWTSSGLSPLCSISQSTNQ